MEMLTYIDSRRMTSMELVFIQPLKLATLLRRFQRYIETSDWDEQIIRKGPLVDKICMGTLILSGLAISPFIVTVLLK